jgi:hypothetical protein
MPALTDALAQRHGWIPKRCRHASNAHIPWNIRRRLPIEGGSYRADAVLADFVTGVARIVGSEADAGRRLVGRAVEVLDSNHLCG